ncbi:fibroblast growth factor 2-like [Xenia sp. Carnegie-2017]|uniref:fibroblast growth factor 2-like n=1 Tax=Xenia sp. Carnegie-2017 TaxID=2897299 RepID=UPI001F035B51|nr:fibroblast growth factor 2-like [Xenia sp. Carnegie-2017]
MTKLYNFKSAFLLLIIVTESIICIPMAKSKRRRKSQASGGRPNVLQVYNYTDAIANSPTNFRTMVLYSTNGLVYLQVNNNMRLGTNQTLGPRAKFIGETMSNTVLRFKNEVSKRYLAINQKGRLLLQRKPNDDCLFVETWKQGFHTYASFKYYKKQKYDTFIAVKNSGDIKSPLLTARDQKAILFMNSV